MDKIFPEKRKINSLFGPLVGTKASPEYKFSEEEGDKTIIDNSIKDYVLRGKRGLQSKIVNADKVIGAMTNPTGYLNAKYNSLESMVTSLENRFKEVYERESKRGISQDEVKKNVSAEINRLMDKEIKIHNEDFPHDLVSRAVRKLTG